MALRITQETDGFTATHMGIDIEVQWDPDWQDQAGRDRGGGGGGGDSIWWWWSREDTMRVLRRVVPDIDSLNGYAMSEEVMSAGFVALQSAICGELEDLLGPNYPPSLHEDVVMEIFALIRLEMDRADQSFLEEHAADTSAEKEIVDELERRSRRHEAAGISGGDGEEAEVCSICLDGLYQENESVAALDCEHEYHVHCIKEWLVRGKNECPLCRGRALHTNI